MTIRKQTTRHLLQYQKNEITEYHIYRILAARMRSPENRKVLEDIANDELRHYKQWVGYTGKDVSPDWRKVTWYSIVCWGFGLTFGVRLMERGEENAQREYARLVDEIADARAIVEDENDHENAILDLLYEERLRYTGSMVLGLNDALVELTGALAGLTFALQNTRLIALTGSITGFAAALSMGASEYLSTKTEETSKKPLKASAYTGTAYIVTVIFLILPYLLLENHFVSLGLTLASAIVIIALFNFYIAVAKGEPFKRRFFEMAGLSLGIASISFAIGFLLRVFFGVDV